jgi:hypothetical protein
MRVRRCLPLAVDLVDFDLLAIFAINQISNMLQLPNNGLQQHCQESIAATAMIAYQPLLRPEPNVLRRGTRL